MRTRFWLSVLVAAAALLALAAAPAAAHHPMGGKLPATMTQGLLSGLGHPIIGLDHLAAIIAVGCIAAWYRTGPALAVGFVAAMIAGVALHLRETTVPASEALVALSVMALGATLVLRKALHPAAALTLFVIAGLLHGYALGESIVGAETDAARRLSDRPRGDPGCDCARRDGVGAPGRASGLGRPRARSPGRRRHRRRGPGDPGAAGRGDRGRDGLSLTAHGLSISLPPRSGGEGGPSTGSALLRRPGTGSTEDRVGGFTKLLPPTPLTR